MSVWAAPNIRNVLRSALEAGSIGRPRLVQDGQKFERLGQPSRMVIRTRDGGKFLITVEEIKEDD